ncbi:unnamed protein product, partial [Didymodactylos carnosus]
FFPLSLERLSEVIISTRRIDEFMNLSKDDDSEKDTDNAHGKDELAGTVLMNKASFCWDAQNQSCLLKDIDINVKQGSLVGVMGSIGSCKSSLLMAILGEMKLSSGTSSCNGTFAYASQTPWIFADTIRENILFGKSLNPERYAKVLQICCLIPDIDSMVAGDLTVIGEKGVNLSGGQRARVSLARAIYDKADIYLFDDPLAAVDSTVAQSIFEDCIGPDGFLKTKSRILVTHQIEFLPKADHCVLLDRGRIKGQGAVVILGIINPWVLFILVPLVPSFIWIRRFFLKSSRQIKRLDSVTRSPIYALFSSSLSGLVTIRAFKTEDNLINSFIERIDANTRAWFELNAGVRWFGLRLDLMTSALTTLMAILTVALRHQIDASSAALGLMYCITLSSMFQWAVRQSAEMENHMTSAERITRCSCITSLFVKE